MCMWPRAHTHTCIHRVPDCMYTVYPCGTKENKAKCVELDAPARRRAEGQRLRDRR